MVKNKNTQATARHSPVIIFALIVALAACGMAGYLYFELKALSGNKDSVRMSSQEEKALPPADPLYVPLKTFTVSLKPDAPGDNRVIYIGLTLRVADKESKAMAEKVLPEIRSRVNLLLTQHTAAQLASAAGKQTLLSSLSDALSQPLAAGQQLQVSDMLLNEFIIR